MYKRRSPKKNQLKQKKKSKSKPSSEVISTPIAVEPVPIKKKSSKIKLLDSRNREIKPEKKVVTEKDNKLKEIRMIKKLKPRSKLNLSIEHSVVEQDTSPVRPSSPVRRKKGRIQIV
jgi:hypothetical protein